MSCLGDVGGFALGSFAEQAEKKALITKLSRGKSDVQKKVIKYFMGEGGCLGAGSLKDADFDAMLNAKLSSIDFKQRALTKIGLDLSQVSEIEPVRLNGYVFNSDVELPYRYGKDNAWRSSTYHVTWLFFSDEQLYAYKYVFRMDSDSVIENIQEYFYKDITAISTTREVEEKIFAKAAGCIGKVNYIRENVEWDAFHIYVPNGDFYCTAKSTDYTRNAIQGMKAKIREKKA